MIATQRSWIRVKKWHSQNPDYGTINKVYQDAAANILMSIKIGGRVLIASDALDQLYEARMRAASGKHAVLETSDSKSDQGADETSS